MYKIYEYLINNETPNAQHFNIQFQDEMPANKTIRCLRFRVREYCCRY